MNKDLKNNIYTCPESIIDELSSNINIYSGDEHAKGHKRSSDIINNPKLPYSKMVKLKHDLNKFNGDEDEFKLIGGEMMRNWVNKVLQGSMDSVSKLKDAKMQGGLQNTHIKAHEKDNNKNAMNTRLDQSNSVTKSNNKTVYDEEIKQMKYLIEYLDNNNKNKII